MMFLSIRRCNVALVVVAATTATLRQLVDGAVPPTAGCFEITPDFGCEDRAVFFRMCLQSSYNSAFNGIATIDATYPAECVEVDDDSITRRTTVRGSSRRALQEEDKKKKKKKKKNKGNPTAGYCNEDCVEERLPSDCLDCGDSVRARRALTSTPPESPNSVFRSVFRACLNYYFSSYRTELEDISFGSLNFTDCPELTNYGF